MGSQLGSSFQEGDDSPMGSDHNRNPAPGTRRGFIWIIGGAAAIVVAIVAVYFLTAPPTPAEAAEQHIEDNYDAVAEELVHGAFPRQPP